MERVLGVFAKEPRPGHVKTRLAAALGADGAARLYAAFLRDFLPRLTSLAVRRILAYTPPSAGDFFEKLAGDYFELEEQQGSGLGERMAGFFRRRFAERPGAVVLVGSDTPDLPLGHIEQAFRELESRDLVLGPCADGGYYLIGMSRWFPEAFVDIDWSTASVFHQTVERIAGTPARLTVLEPWADVDRVADLGALSARIAAAARSGQGARLPETEAVLRSLVE